MLVIETDQQVGDNTAITTDLKTSGTQQPGCLYAVFRALTLVVVLQVPRVDTASESPGEH